MTQPAGGVNIAVAILPVMAEEGAGDLFFYAFRTQNRLAFLLLEEW